MSDCIILMSSYILLQYIISLINMGEMTELKKSILYSEENIPKPYLGNRIFARLTDFMIITTVFVLNFVPCRDANAVNIMIFVNFILISHHLIIALVLLLSGLGSLFVSYSLVAGCLFFIGTLMSGSYYHPGHDWQYWVLMVMWSGGYLILRRWKRRQSRTGDIES